MKRRSFLTGLFKAAAIIALAPQLAFRAPEPEVKVVHYWYQTSRHSACYSEEYVIAMKEIFEANPKFGELLR